VARDDFLAWQELRAPVFRLDGPMVRSLVLKIDLAFVIF